MRTNFPIASLGSHVRQVSKRNKDKAGIEVFSVTNSEGFTRSTDYFSKEVFSKNVSNYKVVRRGQFAYNPSRINVGSIDYLKPAETALVSPLYIVFETDAELYPDYLLRYMKGDWGNAQIRANTEGAVRDSLKYKGLENIKIPLPPLEDQKRIAHLLGKVEGLIARRKQHLQQLDDLLKSVFLEMFGDKGRFVWDNIGNLANKNEQYAISSGPFGSNLTSKHYADSGVIVLRGTNITEGKLNLKNVKYVSYEKAKELRRSALQPLDVVIVAVGSSGQALKIPDGVPDMIMSQNFNKITPDTSKIHPTYLEYCINSEYVQRQFKKEITDTVRTFLSLTKIISVRIPVPPIPLQHQFAVIVEKVEALKSRYQQSLADLEHLYGALSQKAFQGELDLSRVPLPEEAITEKLNRETRENLAEATV